MALKKNISFNYLYRDAGNYKSWGSVVFGNPEELTIEEVEKRLEKAFDQGIYFIADQIDIKEVFLFVNDGVTEDDHCFHEYDSVEVTDENIDDILGRSIAKFIEEVESKSQKGWEVFEIRKQA